MSEPMHCLPQDIVPAGFVRRWAALFIDNLLLAAAFYGVFFVALLAFAGSGGFEALAADDPPAWLVGLQLLMSLAYFMMAGLYYAGMESSKSQATLGKMALAIKVVDMHGQRLGFAHALGRWAAATLSYLTLYIGFLLAAFTQRKQALHDIVAGTQVVDQWAYTEHPERQKRGLSGCLVVFLIAILLVPLLGIIAAISIPAYQDYLERARVAQALDQLGRLRIGVAEHALLKDACPGNDTPGFGPPATYATPELREVELRELADGRCALFARLVGPTTQAAGDRWIELALDRRSGQWGCRSGLPPRKLPASCRD